MTHLTEMFVIFVLYYVPLLLGFILFLMEVKCYPFTNKETIVSEGFRLHCFVEAKQTKPQNNLQNLCISRLSEDLPECFRNVQPNPRYLATEELSK